MSDDTPAPRPTAKNADPLFDDGTGSAGTASPDATGTPEDATIDPATLDDDPPEDELSADPTEFPEAPEEPAELAAEDEHPVDYEAVPAKDHAAHSEVGADLVDEPVHPDFAGEPDHPEQQSAHRAAPALVEPAEPTPVDPAEYAEAAAHPEDLEFGETAPAGPHPDAGAAPVVQPVVATPPTVLDTPVVFAEPPVPPRARHNRLFGAGIALLSSIFFAALYGGLAAGILGLRYTASEFATVFPRFLTAPAFITPIVVFAVVAVLAAIVVNRARWWVHALLSLIVGALVFVLSVGVLLLLENVVGQTPDNARTLLYEALTNPVLIAAGFAAREVALWSGLAISARGRRVVAKNTAAREEHERAVATSELGAGDGRGLVA